MFLWVWNDFLVEVIFELGFDGRVKFYEKFNMLFLCFIFYSGLFFRFRIGMWEVFFDF